MRLDHRTTVGIPLWLVLSGVWTAASLQAHAQETPVTVTYLRCEYRVNPMGIDQAQPRLSWRLESSLRGVKQTGYRIAKRNNSYVILLTP